MVCCRILNNQSWGGLLIIFILILIERRMIIHLIIMKLTIVGLVIFTSSCFTSIANFSEGIVEIMAVIANPILVSITASCFGRILHDRKRSILFNTLSINFILFSDYKKLIVNVLLLNGHSIFNRSHSCSLVLYADIFGHLPFRLNRGELILLIPTRDRSVSLLGRRELAVLICRHERLFHLLVSLFF